jgi:excisionase family DNA binding protein
VEPKESTRSGGTLSRSTQRGAAPVPRLALTREEAAAALGISRSSFRRHVQPHLRLVRRGSLRVVPVSELQRWLEAEATLAGGGVDGD